MSYITRKISKLGKKETYVHFFNTLRYALYVILHPADGYWDLIHAKRGSYSAANFIVIMTLLVHVWKLHFASFIVQPKVNWEEINVLMEFAKILLPALIPGIALYAIKEIWHLNIWICMIESCVYVILLYAYYIWRNIFIINKKQLYKIFKRK